MYMCVKGIEFPSVSTKWTVMYMCVRGIEFPSVSMIFGINYCSMIIEWLGRISWEHIVKLKHFKREQYLYADVDKKSLSNFLKIRVSTAVIVI
jgi:hypothetical protein